MFDRRQFAAAGLSAVGVAALQRSSSAQQPALAEKHTGHDGHHSMFAACAQACSDCQRECDSCASHCAHMLQDGKKQHLDTLMNCRDCAVVCSAASQITASSGPLSSIICKSCAEACAACATACEKFPDDEHMKKCAQECRTCEKACKEMLQHV
jgi:hypothetical protein